MRRLIAAALLLYPRAVRHGHGEEIESLVAELIEHDGRSRPAVLARLAADGLIQRLASRATAWVLVITLALTSFGGLAVSDFAAASAHAPAAVSVRTAAHRRAPLAHARPHRTRRRWAGIIAR
jgi:hypothetical protein